MFWTFWKVLFATVPKIIIIFHLFKTSVVSLCRFLFYFFRCFFLMWVIFKVFIEFVTILLLFFVLDF